MRQAGFDSQQQNVKQYNFPSCFHRTELRDKNRQKRWSAAALADNPKWSVPVQGAGVHRRQDHSGQPGSSWIRRLQHHNWQVAGNSSHVYTMCTMSRLFLLIWFLQKFVKLCHNQLREWDVHFYVSVAFWLRRRSNFYCAIKKTFVSARNWFNSCFALSLPRWASQHTHDDSLPADWRSQWDTDTQHPGLSQHAHVLGELVKPQGASW